MGCRWTGFRPNTNKISIPDLRLSVKPEDRTACYVVNEKFNGSVSY